MPPQYALCVCVIPTSGKNISFHVSLWEYHLNHFPTGQEYWTLDVAEACQGNNYFFCDLIVFVQLLPTTLKFTPKVASGYIISKC